MIADGHLVAGGGKFDGNGSTDAFAGAGDDRNGLK
jgi:hypothetical protein